MSLFVAAPQESLPVAALLCQWCWSLALQAIIMSLLFIYLFVYLLAIDQ